MRSAGNGDVVQSGPVKIYAQIYGPVKIYAQIYLQAPAE